MERKFENWENVDDDDDEDLLPDVVTVLNDVKDQLIAIKALRLFPCFIELSRNTARKPICLQYNIEKYSEFRRFFWQFWFTTTYIVNILLCMDILRKGGYCRH